MEQFWIQAWDSVKTFPNYLWEALTFSNPSNFFSWFILLSLLFLLLEVFFPWRKNQNFLRKDFWLDTFYMFFNLMIFPLIGFMFVSKSLEFLIEDLLGWQNLAAIEVASWPKWVQLLTLFILHDFFSWWVHRLLHRVPILWEFHKVHHSVEEMGYAAHLRYHWMENVIYKGLKSLPLAIAGFGVIDFMIIHIINLAIGHFNHSNIKVSLGPLKYLLNNPQMHIWHHAKELPRPYGVNFGISLSLWDYLFGTAYIPYEGRDIKLGFDDIEDFPTSFWQQLTYPLGKRGQQEDKH